MLKRILSQRVGRYVPLENHQNVIPPNFKLESQDLKTSVQFINPQNGNENVRAYMQSKFYPEAPIPLVLKLSRKNCDHTSEFLNRELNLLVNSGVSLKFCDIETGDIKGIGLSCAWQRNPNYEIINVPLKIWHNTAAEICSDFSPQFRHLIWRDFQFQYIYDLGQKYLQQTKKSGVFYLAMLYLNKELRSSGFSEKGILQTTAATRKHFSFLCQSNFRGFDKSIERLFDNPVLLDEVKYCDETLVLNEKEGRAFKIIDNLDGIRFYGNP